MDPPDLYFSKISNFQNKCNIGKWHSMKILRNIEIETKNIEFRKESKRKTIDLSHVNIQMITNFKILKRRYISSFWREIDYRMIRTKVEHRNFDGSKDKWRAIWTTAPPTEEEKFLAIN